MAQIGRLLTPKILGIGRWGRARNLLQRHEHRVLDAGCAFGFGTAQLHPQRNATGLERDWAYLTRARHDHPALPLVQGDVARLPFQASSFDAVLLLEVIEHLPYADAAIREAHRVLRPGGALILSVPHRGALATLDSLNLYARWRARWGWPELAATERGAPEHRHFALTDLESLLEGFHIEQVVRTGTGLAEPVHLALLVILRGLARQETMYRRLAWLYFALAVADDYVPLGRWSYQVMIRAIRN